MADCEHRQLVLLPPPKNRLRCQHCHLTVNPDDLSGRYCPECYERDGRRRNDFDEVEAVDTGRVQYRCEDCGAMIDT